MLRFGYNTNGLAHHRLGDALELLAGAGYAGVALTPDVGHLDPMHASAAEVIELRKRLEDLGLAVTVETGARFVLDPGRKHFPTLMEEGAADRARRVEFLRRCIDLGAELGAEAVSFWAGRAPSGEVGDGPEGSGGSDASRQEALWDRLCEGVAAVLEGTRGPGLAVGFEPEPGMFLERPAGFLELVERLGSVGDQLGLCLDVGHLLCTGDLPVEGVIDELGERLVAVHLDDIRGGVHEHRMFGEGDLDLEGALGALERSPYVGLSCVELSRDSHRGAWAAVEALRRLRSASGDRPKSQ